MDRPRRPYQRIVDKRSLEWALSERTLDDGSKDNRGPGSYDPTRGADTILLIEDHLDMLDYVERLERYADEIGSGVRRGSP